MGTRDDAGDGFGDGSTHRCQGGYSKNTANGNRLSYERSARLASHSRRPGLVSPEFECAYRPASPRCPHEDPEPLVWQCRTRTHRGSRRDLDGVGRLSGERVGGVRHRGLRVGPEPNCPDWLYEASARTIDSALPGCACGRTPRESTGHRAHPNARAAGDARVGRRSAIAPRSNCGVAAGS